MNTVPSYLPYNISLRVCHAATTEWILFHRTHHAILALGFAKQRQLLNTVPPYLPYNIGLRICHAATTDEYCSTVIRLSDDRSLCECWFEHVRRRRVFACIKHKGTYREVNRQSRQKRNRERWRVWLFEVKQCASKRVC